MTDSAPSPRLTVRGLTARAVLLPLARPVVARIATISEWPMVLIDLETEEGVVGRSYLEPYIPRAMRYLLSALDDLGDLLRGRPVAPADLYEAGRKSLHFVGYEGLSAIAVSGVDMAAWDALAKAAGQPLCVLLGGSVGPVRAYNSNGLWLHEPAAVADDAVRFLTDEEHAARTRRALREVRAKLGVPVAAGDGIVLRRRHAGNPVGPRHQRLQRDEGGHGWGAPPAAPDGVRAGSGRPGGTSGQPRPELVTPP